jgi:hypothetical protein
MADLQTRFLCRYTAELELPQQDVGVAHFGQRLIAHVTGGAIEGERIRGRVLDGGGDWATIDLHDVLRLDARVTWETDDGARIYVSYRGILRPRAAARRMLGEGLSSEEVGRRIYFRTAPIFETGDERYRWLNDMVAIAMGTVSASAVHYDVFEVL